MSQQSLSREAAQEPQSTPTPEELDAHLSSDPESAVPAPEAQGWFGKFAFVFCIFVALSHIYFNTLGNMSELWLSAMHFGMFGFLCALLYRTGKHKTGAAKSFHWGINILLGVLSLVVVGYLMLGESALYARGVTFITTDWLAAIIAVVLVVEFARRTSGWVIPVMILIALSYVA
ncbi:hypothetical protein ABMA58_17980, partial [Oceanospirillum sp. HFRX-1_2]